MGVGKELENELVGFELGAGVGVLEEGDLVIFDLFAELLALAVLDAGGTRDGNDTSEMLISAGAEEDVDS